MTATFDVAVIGGGIAGASAAAHLSVSRSVVLLEQESELAFHTTSRSAAIYTENEGGGVVSRLSSGSRAFFEADRDIPLLTPLGVLFVGPPEMEDTYRAQAAEAAQWAPTIEYVSGAELTERCPVLRPERAAVGIWEPAAASIDVMALHQTYIRSARAENAEVCRSSKVTALERIDDRWRIGTASGHIDADVVVNAAGAWGDEVGALAGARPIGLTPMRRTAFTSPIDLDPRGWPFVYAPIPGAACYFKPEAGNQLLCSPADETPSDPVDARPEEIDIARAIDHLNQLTTLELRSVSTSWAGLRTFAPDRDPVYGWDDRVDGFVWMVGQGGTGILTSPAAGRVIAGVVTGEDIPQDLEALGLTASSLAPRR